MGVRGDGEVNVLSNRICCREGRGIDVTRLLGAVVVALLAVGSVFLPLQAAKADSTTYSTSKRQFKVGVLLVDSTGVNYNNNPPTAYPGGAENPDPFVFYIADARTDVKPQNWDLINPLAPSTVTAEILTRWTNRNSNQVPFQLGQKITKDMAPYWEVSLNNTSLADLLQYDLLFITNHRDTGFTPSEREKLRKVVDGGGIVWIEDCGNMRIRPGGTFFLEELQFRNEGSAANAGPVINQPDHPILNTPYKLTFQEIANLGDKNYANYYISKMLPNEQPSPARNASGRGTGIPNSNTLINIVGNEAADNQPYIAAGSYGSGAVIATAGDSGCDINDYAGGVSNSIGSGGNSGAVCGKNIISAHTEDLKFVYNLIAWGSSSTTFRRSPRRTAASFDNVGAPLVESFSLLPNTVAAGDIIASNSAPLIINGVMYVTGRINTNGPAVLAAYDANPSTDLDGDGNPDDGVIDLSAGKPFDLLWSAPLGGSYGVGQVQPSAPVYGIVNTPARPIACIFVTMPDGTLRSFEALPTVPATRKITGVAVPLVNNPGNVIGGAVYSPPVNLGQNPDLYAAPAPVFFENKVFVTQADGSVRCVDPTQPNLTLYQTFTTAITKPNARTLQASASGTLGYVAQRNTTALARASNGNTNDLMLYQPILEPTPASGNGPIADILPYWLGTRNEVIRNGDNTTGIFKTRVAGNLNLVQPTPPATLPTLPTKYGVANGTGAPGPALSTLFIKPRVRIFATEFGIDPATGDTVIIRTPEQNLAEGIEAPAADYSVVPDANGAQIAYDGQITVVKGGSNLNFRDILLAVDYDVFYNEPGNGYSNAREGKPLGIDNVSSTVATAALTPDDLLLYGFTQDRKDSGGNVVGKLSSLVATNEQEGPGATTRQRLRMNFHNGYDSVTIGNTTVSDVPVFRNRLQFTNNWPTVAATLPNNFIEGIEDVTLVGAPISTSSGIAYQLASGTSVANNGRVTLLIGIKTNQDVVLTLPEAYSQGQQVTVQQYNLLDGSGSQTPQPIQRQVGQPGLDGDPARGRITITNFQAQGSNGFSATQSFVVTYTPAGATTPRSVVLSPTPSLVGEVDPTDITNPNNNNTNTTGSTTSRVASSGFTPILWYYVLPGVPVSSPTLNGDVIYFMQQRNGQNFIVAADADPAANDPRVRSGSGEQILGVSDSGNNVNHIRWADVPVSSVGAGDAVAPPVGGQGILAMTGNDGLRVYQNAITLITDSKRVIEVDGSSAALWSVDATFRSDTIGGELPIYNGLAGLNGGGAAANDPLDTGRTAIQRKALSQPSMARRLASADYLVADTGNNRVFRMDRSGKLIWNMSEASDPFGILAVGEPKTLSAPTDVQVYVVNTLDNVATPNSIIGYEIHYLIADTGNSRILEVADYYDTRGRIREDLQANGTFGGGGARGEHVVVYTTRTSSAQNRSLTFQSVQRIAPPDASGNPTPPILVAVVGNTAVAAPNTTSNADAGGGSLVQIQYTPFRVPAVTPWTNPAKTGAGTEPANNGTIGQAFSQITVVTGGTPSVQRITRPTYFQEVTIRDPAGSGTFVNVYYLCDATGVYGLVYDPPGTPAANTTGRLRAYWAFRELNYQTLNNGAAAPNTVFRFGLFATPSQAPRFVPTSVQRLANNDFLITNGFTGSSPLFKNGQFLGEALQVKLPGVFDGTNTLIGGIFAGFSAPRLNIEGDTTLPNTVRYRQTMGSSDGNATLLEQPRSSSRQ